LTLRLSRPPLPDASRHDRAPSRLASLVHPDGPRRLVDRGAAVLRPAHSSRRGRPHPDYAWLGHVLASHPVPAHEPARGPPPRRRGLPGGRASPPPRRARDLTGDARRARGGPRVRVSHAPELDAPASGGLVSLLRWRVPAATGA